MNLSTKRIILTTVIVAVFQLGYTQVVNFGVKAGLMSTSMPMKGIGQWGTSSNLSGQVGAYVLKDFPGIFLQLEVDYYISMGVTFEHTGGGNVDVSFNALVIPLLVGKKFQRVRVFLGPSLWFVDGSSLEDAQAQMDQFTRSR